MGVQQPGLPWTRKHNRWQPTAVTLGCSVQGGAASIRSRALPASHRDGAACVREGDERRPLQPLDLPPLQGVLQMPG